MERPPGEMNDSGRFHRGVSGRGLFSGHHITTSWAASELNPSEACNGEKPSPVETVKRFKQAALSNSKF